MIAGAYVRKSTDEADKSEDAKSISRQIERAKEFATSRGWHFDDRSVFSDDGISGAEFRHRPGLNKLIAALTPKPPFDALIVSEISRLGRDTVRTLGLIQAITDSGVSIHSYLDGREVSIGDEMGEVEQFMKSWASSQERKRASERTRDAVRLRAERGHVPGGRVFGYRNVKVAGHTERAIEPSEAEVVRRIFRRRAEGWGVYRIARELETLGIPSPRGRATWTQAQVAIICRNELYTGRLVWGRTRGIKRKGTASRVESPESIIRTKVPALRIVDDPLWMQVQRQMQQAREYHQNGLARSSPGISPGLLAPVIACGECGGGMYLRAGKDRRSGKHYPAYVCTRNSTKGKRACPNGHRLPAERADAAILAAFEEEILSSDMVPQVIMAELSRMQRAQVDRDTIEANMAQVEGELSRLVRGLAAVGSSATIARAIAEREASLAALKSQRDEINVLGDVEFEALLPQVLEKVTNWKGYLRSNPIGLTQAVLKKILPDRIRFTPGEHGTWRFQGRASYGKLLEGIIPKVPRTGRSSSW